MKHTSLDTLKPNRSARPALAKQPTFEITTSQAPIPPTMRELINDDAFRLLTCDIKQLERNQLRGSTGRMDWDDVLRVSSSDEFIIELAEGRRVRGSLLDSGADRRLRDLSACAWPRPCAGSRWASIRASGKSAIGTFIVPFRAYAIRKIPGFLARSCGYCPRQTSVVPGLH